MVALTGKEVGKVAEFLFQVLTQGVEFSLDSSSSRLLICCRVSRVPGRSKMWVAPGASDVVNCSKGYSRLLFINI